MAVYDLLWLWLCDGTTGWSRRVADASVFEFLSFFEFGWILVLGGDRFLRMFCTRLSALMGNQSRERRQGTKPGNEGRGPRKETKTGNQEREQMQGTKTKNGE